MEQAAYLAKPKIASCFYTLAQHNVGIVTLHWTLHSSVSMAPGGVEYNQLP